MCQKEIKPYTVLIIDDEESMRDSCRQVLEKQGFLVKAAPDGKSGLEMVDSVKPDIVILDLKMPGLQGIDVLKELRKSDPQSVVIVITGYPSIESGIEAMKCGAYDFLIKPFTPQELRMIIRGAVEHRNQIRRSHVLAHEKEKIPGDFSAPLVHQLKTPLASIEEYIALLYQELPGPHTENQKKLVDKIHFRVKQLRTLIDDSLRLEGDK